METMHCVRSSLGGILVTRHAGQYRVGFGLCKGLLAVFMISLKMGCIAHRQDSATQGAPRRVAFRQGETVPFNPAHFEGPFTVAGDFDLDPDMIAKRYRRLSVDLFGSVSMDLAQGVPLTSRATGKRKYIRDLHYHLGNNKIGIRPIPIVDRVGWPRSLDPEYKPKGEENTYWNYPVAGRTADGYPVQGSELMDRLLRTEYGLGENDTSAPVFGLLAYLHPEKHYMTFRDLGDLNYLKTENGMTHLSGYIGKGQARNAPLNYHDFRWRLTQDDPDEDGNVMGYPVNVYTVKPKWAGVDQRTFLENLHITLRLLNELNGGVVFATDYKVDWFRAINLKETLAFYRAWIDPQWKRYPTDTEPFLTKLKNDKSYYSYCTEHLTIVLNVALNLVQNEQGYVDVWGPVDGKALWNLAKSRYENRERLVYDSENFSFVTKTLGKIPGSEIPKIESKKFSPLWKVHGIKSPSEETGLGRSLAFPPETTADLMAHLVEQYANWTDVGPVMASAVIFQLMPEVMRRTGVSAEKYFELATPFIAKMIKHDASTNTWGPPSAIPKAYEEYLKQVEHGWLKGTQAQPGLRQVLKTLAAAPGMQPVAGMVDSIVSKIMKPLKSEALKKWILTNTGKDVNLEAWPAFVKDAKVDLVKAQELDMVLGEGVETIIKDKDGTELVQKHIKYYVPPAVIHRIVSGMHPYDDKNIEFKAVATVMDAQELRRSDKSPFKDYEVK